MVHAVIMIRTGPGAATDVRDAVGDIEGVVDAHVVAGDFDVIAEVDAGEVYEAIQTASTSIQGTDGVEDTKTYVALA